MAYEVTFDNLPEDQAPQGQAPSGGGYQATFDNLPPDEAAQLQYPYSAAIDLPGLQHEQSLIEGIRHGLWSIPADIASGLSKGTYDVLNPVLHPVLAAIQRHIPSSWGINIDQPPESFNKSKNPVDKFVENVAEFVPTALGGEAAIPSRIAQTLPQQMAKWGFLQGAYDKSKGGSPWLGGVLGAATAGAPAGVEKAIRHGGSAAAKMMGGGAIKEVFDKLFRHTSSTEPAQQAVDKIQFNRQQALDKYNVLADQAEQSAKNLDESARSANYFNPHLKYNNQSYKNAVNDISRNLRKKIVSQEGLGELQHWNDAPSSFTDAIQKRKLLNAVAGRLPSNEYKQLAPQLGKVRRALIDNVEENADKHARLGNVAAQDFLVNWRNANQHYRDNVVPYEQLHDATGRLVSDNQLTGAFGEDSRPSSGLVNRFLMPSKNPDLNVALFHKLVDDPDISNEALRTTYLKNMYDTHGTPTPGFLKQIVKSSPAVQKSIMSTPQLQRVEEARALHTHAPKHDELSRHSTAALVGGEVSHALGKSWGAGLLGGLLAHKAMSKTIPALFAHPSGSGLRALRTLELLPTKPSRLSPHLTPVLSGIISPIGT